MKLLVDESVEVDRSDKVRRRTHAWFFGHWQNV